MNRVVPLSRGGLVCSMKPKASYVPDRLDAGICFKRGRSAGFKAGMMTQEIQKLKEDLNLVASAAKRDLRQYKRSFRLSYNEDRLSTEEVRELISNAIREKIESLKPQPNRRRPRVQDIFPQQ